MTSVFVVYRFASLIALLLVVLWLPATQHCNFEAAGLIAEQCADESTPGPAHANDSCDVVENGLYKDGSHTVTAPAPTMSADPCLLCLLVSSLAFAPTPSVIPDQMEGRALAWVVTWQFVRRAAAPAHAPDSLIV